ncbi:UNVERIFIED_ORG: hypothetical protein ABIC54_004460 [Burkholderia sp. 1263]
MKSSRFLAICAAIYVSPHVSPMVGISAGIWFLAWSFYHAWRDE